MFEIFSRLGRWLVATLRGSEDGSESGALHVLKTDSDGRLEVVMAYAGMGLADLDDVADTLAPTDGQLLTYDAAAGEWDAATLSLALGDLNNVDDSIVPSDGALVLRWVDAPDNEFRVYSLSLGDLYGVDLTSAPVGGELLFYDSNDSKWEALPLGGVDGNILVRDANGPSWGVPAGAWSFSAVDADYETLITGGSLTAALVLMYVVHAISGGATVTGHAALELGDTLELYNDGTNVLTIACDVGGTVTLYRSAGTDTFNVTILGGWL